MTESPQQPPTDPTVPPVPPVQPVQPVYGQQPPTGYGQPPPPGYGPPSAYGQAMMSPSDMKLWGGAAWWGTFILSFIAPLVIMLTKGNEHPFVRKQAVESLNFQLTTLIGYIASFVLMLVLIGFLTIIAVIVFHLVITIIASIKTSNGEDYRAPLTIRFIS